MRPTVAGEAYLAACRRALSILDEGEAAPAGAGAEPVGRLRVGAPLSFGRLEVAPAAADLMRRRPGVEVDLRLSDQIARPAADGVDAVVRIVRDPDPAMVWRPVGRQVFATCASPAYVAERGRPAGRGDLARHPRLAMRSPITGRPFPWRTGAGGGRMAEEVPDRPRAETDNADADAAVAWALGGLGLLNMPTCLVAPLLASGALVEVLPRHRAAAEPIRLGWPPQARAATTGALRALLDHALPALRDACERLDAKT